MVIELNVVIVFIEVAVSKEYFNYLNQKLPNIVNELMGALQMFLERDSALLDDVVVEYQVPFDRVEG